MFVKDLSKRYDGKTVVDGVSFSIPKGKVISLIGPNGAGKSTVMGMISRLIAHDSGLVEFEGKDIGKWKSKELSKRLAILTQSNSIQMKLTVRELVAFGRFPYSGSRITPEDTAVIDRAIAYMELEEFQDQFIDELSGGQRQRALIAMVIAQDTEYVLLDEPTNNLDIYHATNMMKIVRRLCDELGKTVILVLHEINYAAFYSDYICAFQNGKVAKIRHCGGGDDQGKSVPTLPGGLRDPEHPGQTPVHLLLTHCFSTFQKRRFYHDQKNPLPGSGRRHGPGPDGLRFPELRICRRKRLRRRIRQPERRPFLLRRRQHLQRCRSASGESAPETVTITTLDGSGQEIELEVPYNPQRIAILDMACLDILDALGVGDRVVGTASTSLEYLQSYINDSISNLGTIKEADLEAVMACEPDVIFIGGRLSASYDAPERDRPGGLSGHRQRAGRSGERAQNAATIASMFGLESQVEELMSGFDTRIEALQAAAEGQNRHCGHVHQRQLQCAGQ